MVLATEVVYFVTIYIAGLGTAGILAFLGLIGLRCTRFGAIVMDSAICLHVTTVGTVGYDTFVLVRVKHVLEAMGHLDI